MSIPGCHFCEIIDGTRPAAIVRKRPPPGRVAWRRDGRAEAGASATSKLTWPPGSNRRFVRKRIRAMTSAACPRRKFS